MNATSFPLPPLVFGSTCLGNLFRTVPEDSKAAIVKGWVESSLRPVVIDSAGKYGAGMSLETIGRELNRLHVAPGEIVVSNKLGWRRVPLHGPEPTFEPGAWFGLEYDAVQDIGYDGILRCYQEGLELLQGHPSQMVSVHDPDEYLAAAQDAADRQRRFEDILAAYTALDELKQRGEVAAVGVGAKSWQVIEELSQQIDLDWVMFANSLTLLEHPPALLEFISRLAERGTQVINSALFHGGFLLGGDFFDYRRVDPLDAQDAARLAWRERFEQVCHKYAVTPFEVGVAFGRAHPGVTAIALSTSRAERIPSHLAAIRSTIPTDLWQALRDAELLPENCALVP